MTRLFNPANPVMQFIGKIGYSIFLNILWVVCCIPIVTIGASTTALFHCAERLVHDQYDSILYEFFHSFKMNFKQATVIWLIVFGSGVVLGTDAYVLWRMHSESIFWTMISAVFIIAVAAYVIVVMYVFPLLAHFDNSTFAMFKNSIMIGMRFLICTVLMAAIYFVMGWLTINVFTPLIFLGMGSIALLSSYLLGNVFAQCEGTEE